jgi:hypothetical protein
MNEPRSIYLSISSICPSISSISSIRLSIYLIYLIFSSIYLFIYISQEAVYSQGFLSKSQLKAIRFVLDDATVTHFVLMSEKPFIPLTEISIDPIAPSMLLKGDILPWAPTVSDLAAFFDSLIRWQDPGPSSSRSILTLTLPLGSPRLYLPYR